MGNLYKDRRLQAYSLAFHVDGQPGDYGTIFENITRPRGQNRVIEKQDDAIGLAEARRQGDGFRARIVQGERGLAPLLFDLDSGSAAPVPMGDRQVSVHAIHAVVDVVRRLAVVEYCKFGAKSDNVAALFSELIGRSTGNPASLIQLSPIPGPKWEDEVDRFQRVSSVELRIGQPNPGWDDAGEVFKQIGDPSGAREIAITAKSQRRDSLKKDIGIVVMAKHLPRERHPSVQEAIVTGKYAEEPGQKTIRLSKQVKTKTVRVALDGYGHVKSNAIYPKLTDFLEEVASQETSDAAHK